MANIKSVERDVHRSRKKNIANSKKRSELRTAYKKLQKNLADKNIDESQETYRMYTKLLDTAARKGLIKKNMASRHKSRLALQINKLKA